MKWATSYSSMNIREAEKRLGIRIDELKARPLDRMLANAKGSFEVDTDTILKIKEKVYEQITQYLEIEGFPTEASPDFKEANVTDLIYSIISPILAGFRRKTGRKIRLEREKDIISTDNETGGMEEFVVMDRISVTEENFVFIIEAKRSSVGQAIKQCLLSLKDVRDNNGNGEVYGFVTTGQVWQVFSYDGASFKKMREMTVVFDGMDEDKVGWMRDNSALVDCMVVVLANGGIVKKDVIVG